MLRVRGVCQVLCSVLDQRAAVSEIHRVLRWVGGYMVTSHTTSHSI